MPRFRQNIKVPSWTPGLDELDVIDAILSSCGPSLLSRSLIGQVGKQKKAAPASLVTLNCLKSKFVQLKRRSLFLESENQTLEQQNIFLRVDLGLVQDELQNARISCYEGLERERRHLESSKRDQATIKSLEHKVHEFGEFIRTLVALKLDNPLYRAALAVMDDVDCEYALVDAIQKAAENKKSAWFRIISAVTGPRSPENYISALNLTLRARKDLHECKKIAGFWKLKAMIHPDNAGLITPSPSTLSDFRDEVLESKGAKCSTELAVELPVLDDMLNALKSGDIWPKSAESFHPTALRLEVTDGVQTFSRESSSEALSSSLLSREVRGPVLEQHEHLEDPSSSSTVGSTTNHDDVPKDVVPEPVIISQRTVRFVLSPKNALYTPTTGSDWSPSQSLSEISQSCDKAGACSTSTDFVQWQESSQIAETISDTESVLSDYSSVLSDVYKDFFDETEGSNSPLVRDEKLYIVRPGQVVRTGELNSMGSYRGTRENLLRDKSASSSSSPKYHHVNKEESLQRSNGFRTSGEASNSVDNAIEIIQRASLPVGNEIRLADQSPLDKIASKHKIYLEESKRNRLYDETEQRVHKADKMRSSGSLDSTSSSGTARAHERSHIKFETKYLNKASSSRTASKFLTSATRKASASVKSRTSDSPTMRSPKARESGTSVVTPTKKPSISKSPPSIPRNNSPPRRDKSYSPKLSTSRPSATRSLESDILPSTSSPSRTQVSRRPALGQIDTNIVPSTPQRVHTTRERSGSIKEIRKPLGYSTKDQAKRRGVIMVHKLNIIPTSKTSSKNSRPSTPPKALNCGPPTSQRHVLNDASKNDNDIQNVKATTLLETSPDSASPHASDSLLLDQSDEPLESSKANANNDLSECDAKICELLALLSSSDLGSLETTEEHSDSECEDLCDALENNEDSVFHSPSTSLVTIKSSKHEAFGKATTYQDVDHEPNFIASQDDVSTQLAATVSSSSSSSSSSSTSSLYLESPTHSRAASKVLSLAIAHSPCHAVNTSQTRTDKTASSFSKIEAPAKARKLSSPPTKATAAHMKPAMLLAPRVTTSPSPSSQPQKIAAADEDDKKAVSQMPANTTGRPSPVAQKQMRHPISLKSDIIESDSSAAPESKSWIGQGLLRRISNASSKNKTNPTVAQPIKTVIHSGKSDSKYLSPGSPQVKPRSNTISTLSPPQSSTPSSLSLSSPTKPRSNTVNTYSPPKPSPLSQHVTNASLEFQSRLNHTSSSRSPPRTTESTSLHKRSRQAVSNSRNTAAANKLSTPLRISTDGTAIMTRSTDPIREVGSAPPTAAFMRPTLTHTSISPRRMTNSVAPLIPNWTSSPNGSASPGQRRNMFRNSLSMVVR